MRSHFRSLLSLLCGFLLVLLAGCRSIPKEHYTPIRVVCDDQLREVTQEFFPEIARSSGRTIETRFIHRNALADYALTHSDTNLVIASQEQDLSSVRYLFEYRDPQRAPVLLSGHQGVLLITRDPRGNPEGTWLKTQLSDRGWYERLDELGQPMNRYTLRQEERGVWDMLESTHLNSIPFHNSSIPEALQVLDHELRKQHPGISIPFFTSRIHAQPAPSLTLEVRNLSILECIQFITELTGTTFRVHSRGVEVYAKTGNGGQRQFYRVRPDLEPLFSELSRAEGARNDVLEQWVSSVGRHSIHKLQQLDPQQWTYEEMIGSLMIMNPEHLDLHMLEDQLWRIHQETQNAESP